MWSGIIRFPAGTTAVTTSENSCLAAKLCVSSRKGNQCGGGGNVEMKWLGERRNWASSTV